MPEWGQTITELIDHYRKQEKRAEVDREADFMNSAISEARYIS